MDLDFCPGVGWTRWGSFWNFVFCTGVDSNWNWGQFPSWTRRMDKALALLRYVTGNRAGKGWGAPKTMDFPWFSHIYPIFVGKQNLLHMYCCMVHP